MKLAEPLTSSPHGIDWLSMRQQDASTTHFMRQGVFEDNQLIGIVANRLKKANLIEKAKVFPYQLLTTWKSITDEMPQPIRDALQDAMEVAIHNVPQISGQVYVFPDISGSMQSPVTGHRAGSTTSHTSLVVACFISTLGFRI